MKAASIRPLQCVGAEGSTGGEAELDLAGREVGGRGARRQAQPPARKLDGHELIQTPCRDWCGFRTRGRGVPDRHAGRRQAGDLGEEMTAGATGSCVPADGNTSDGKEVAKYVLVCHDQKTRSVGAHTVWERGAGSKGIMGRIVKDL